jgi:hypothetical protein
MGVGTTTRSAGGGARCGRKDSPAENLIRAGLPELRLSLKDVMLGQLTWIGRVFHAKISCFLGGPFGDKTGPLCELEVQVAGSVVADQHLIAAQAGPRSRAPAPPNRLQATP